MNDYVDYKQEEEIRREVSERIERDTEEGLEQYAQLTASMVGLREWFDKPPSERMGIYITHPPLMPAQLVTRDMLMMYPPELIQEVGGVPPPDQQGMYPAYTALAAEFPAYYIRIAKDFLDLYKKWEDGKLNPKEPTEE